MSAWTVEQRSTEACQLEASTLHHTQPSLTIAVTAAAAAAAAASPSQAF